MQQSASLEYAARIAARTATRDTLTASDARFAHARLAVVAGTVVLAVAIWRGALGAWWLLLPVALFAWLMQRHDRVLRARDEASRGIEFYQRGVARIEDRWRGSGEPGERFRDDRHVYANDLDLFGSGSLFELLSQARTRLGEELLARWLTSPADRAEIQARQDAVQELSGALDLREQLAVTGANVRKSVHTDRLLAWAESPMPPTRALELLTWTATIAAGARHAVFFDDRRLVAARRARDAAVPGRSARCASR